MRIRKSLKMRVARGALALLSYDYILNSGGTLEWDDSTGQWLLTPGRPMEIPIEIAERWDEVVTPEKARRVHAKAERLRNVIGGGIASLRAIRTLLSLIRIGLIDLKGIWRT